MNKKLIADLPTFHVRNTFKIDANKISANFTDVLILARLKDLNPKKSRGVYGVHPLVLRSSAEGFAKPVRILFQKSWEESQVPRV